MAEIKWVPDIVRNYTTRKIEKTSQFITADDPHEGVPVFWQQDKNCSGFIVDTAACSLRVTEMSLEQYQPYECVTKEIPNCQKLVAYARFNIKKI